MLWFLLACGGAPPECGPEACASVCAAPEPAPSVPAAPAAPVEPRPTEAADGQPSQKMSPFEHQLLDELMTDVRAGIRPWDDQGIGVCAGKKECTTFLGANAGELPKGDYLVKAELRVPAIGEKGTWKVDFHTECSIEHPGSPPEIRTYDRGYDVWYAGPERGYRLIPLRTFESPSKGGAQRCTFQLTAHHPDGDRLYEGSWSTPGA